MDKKTIKPMQRAARLDLNALPVFAAVAEMGGFTAAAEQLGVAKAKVSLEIARLEAQLGVTLFVRTTRRVSLTDAGQALYAECIPQLRGMQESLAGLAADQALSGTLRISATVEHAMQSLAGTVTRFAALHPALQVELRTSDKVADVVKEGIDVAIRMGWLRDSTLRSTRLGEFEQYVVASPAYLRRAGVPRAPQDLASHDWVGLTLLPAPFTWKFTNAKGQSKTVRTSGQLRCDSNAALRALLVNGAGISTMDSITAAEAIRAGSLTRVLSGWQLPRGGIHAVYAPGRHVQPKVRAFIDFYAKRLQGAVTD
jgi:DNA-binding transcriptional LysR family regulator